MIMISTIAPSPPVVAAVEAPTLQVWRVPVTIDGYIELLAADKWSGQRQFEQLSLQQIAEQCELWSGDPEMKEEAPK